MELFKKLTQHQNFFLFAGPCAIEDQTMPLEIATRLKEITDRLDIPYVFKASYKKANRSRVDSFTGIGDIEALEVLKKVSTEVGVPTITDIHSVEEAYLAAKYVDILQIPAFLARQTELLVAAGQTGKIVSIKKGQFMSPEAMQFAVDKVRSTGNEQVLITERGTMFGYGDLVVDYRGIPKMQEYAPTVLDITHSLQQPNTSSGVTGGLPHLIETIAKAGISVGVDGIFLETHPNPSKAKSDGANMLPLHQVEPLLKKLVKLHEVTRYL